MVELVDHPNDVENIDFEADFDHLLEDADVDTMLGQLEEVPRQMLLCTDNADLDGTTPPQPPPEEVATPVTDGLTYIWDMFNLDVLKKIIQADRQPRAQQNDNTEENDTIDNETQDDNEEIFTLEGIMNH